MIRLVGDRVLVRPDPVKPPRTESGIEIAEAYFYAPEVSGTVVAIGEGPRAENGTLLPHCVSLGERVAFAPESGFEMMVDQERLIVLREADLLGVIA